MSAMHGFIEGALTFGDAIVGLFFLHFWRTTGDRLFAASSAAFGLIGANRVMLTAIEVARENLHCHSMSRLFSYGVILWGIIDKDRARPARSEDP
jgi:hypothetical protein